MTRKCSSATSAAFRSVWPGSLFAVALLPLVAAAAQPGTGLPFEMRWVEGSCARCSAGWQLGETLFTSRSEAWAVGATGPVPGQEGMGARALLHTGDGGHTWTEVPGTECYAVPPPIAFLDTKRGWTETCRGPELARVTLHTEDGGASWQDVTGALPVFPHILDDDHWWGIDARPLFPQVNGRAWNRTLMLTADAGRHWTKSPLPRGVGDFPTVKILSASTGWAGNVAGDEFVVFRTTDAGRTWDESRTRTPTKPAQLRDLFFIDPSRGWLIVDYSLRQGFNGEGSYVFSTVDGGRTWTRVAIQAVAAQPAFWVRFLSESLGFIFVERGASSSESSAADGPTLVYTSDGGKRWRVAAVPDPVVGCQAFQGDLLCSALSSGRRLAVLTIHPK